MLSLLQKPVWEEAEDVRVLTERRVRPSAVAKEEWQITKGLEPEGGGAGSHSSAPFNPFLEQEQTALGAQPWLASRGISTNGRC